MRNELDEIAAEHPDRVRVWYTLDRASEGLWVHYLKRLLMANRSISRIQNNYHKNSIVYHRFLFEASVLRPTGLQTDTRQAG